jgi:hypothetical protein
MGRTSLVVMSLQLCVFEKILNRKAADIFDTRIKNISLLADRLKILTKYESHI